MLKLPGHGRYAYSPIVKRPDYTWPGGKRLAFYCALNVEHFSFGEGLGHTPTAPGPQPDVRNFGWRDYGLRVGIWRIFDLMDELDLPHTLEETGKNAGMLSIQMRPERRNAVKVLMFLDVGGSMDWHIKVAQELFADVDPLGRQVTIAGRRRSASAPVEASTPGILPISGCPPRILSRLQKLFSSSTGK